MANTPTPFQPTILLDPNSVITDAEQNFIDESPPNLFPENQDSNWGYKRKVFSDAMQEAIDQLDTIYNERYIETASQFLDEWEEQMSLPIAPTNFTEAERRAIVQGRLKKGAWTHERVEALIEAFLSVTYGPAVLITPEGIELTAAGVPFYSEPGGLKSLYRVYHDPISFSYTVVIRNDIAPTMRIAELTRELVHFTPSPITFTIDTSPANVLDYDKEIKSDGPSGYWELAALTNSIPIIVPPPTTDLTATGAPGSVAALAQRTGTNNALSFSGTGQYLSMSNLENPFKHDFSQSVEFWFKTTAGVTTKQGLAHRAVAGTGGWYIQVETTSRISYNIIVGTTVYTVTSQPIANNTVYHVVATYDNSTMVLYLNGVKSAELAVAGPMTSTNAAMQFARAPGGELLTGQMDELAYYSYPLSAKQILSHYNTGINLP